MHDIIIGISGYQGLGMGWGGRWMWLQKHNIRDHVVVELFCILAVVVNTQTYTPDESV